MTEEERKVLAASYLQELHAAKRRATLRRWQELEKAEGVPRPEFSEDSLEALLKEIIAFQETTGKSLTTRPTKWWVPGVGSGTIVWESYKQPKIQWQPGWFTLTKV